MRLPQDRNGRGREAAEEQRAPYIEGSGRNHDRRQEQQREGIFDAAGEEEQRRQLQDVIGKERRRLARAHPFCRRIGDGENNVEHRAGRDGRRRQKHRKIEIQHQEHDKKRHRLADHGKPAQIVQRADTDASVRASLHIQAKKRDWSPRGGRRVADRCHRKNPARPKNRPARVISGSSRPARNPQQNAPGTDPGAYRRTSAHLGGHGDRACLFSSAGMAAVASL